MRERKQMALVATIHPDEGFWSWQSSPHVLWLANVLAGVSYA
jgi:hypothetical protein